MPETPVQQQDMQCRISGLGKITLLARDHRDERALRNGSGLEAAAARYDGIKMQQWRRPRRHRTGAGCSPAVHRLKR